MQFETGTKKFEVRDVSGVGNSENALSKAVANYTSQGTLQTYQQNYTSTRIIHIEGDQSVYTKPAENNNSGGGGGGDDNWPADHGHGGNTGTAGYWTNNQCYATESIDDILASVGSTSSTTSTSNSFSDWMSSNSWF